MFLLGLDADYPRLVEREDRLEFLSPCYIFQSLTVAKRVASPLLFSPCYIFQSLTVAKRVASPLLFQYSPRANLLHDLWRGPIALGA